jgi:hypothetical protein
MFRGLCNISYWAGDVAAATSWYREVLGIEPYFVRPEEGAPAYVEFRVGDSQDEVGLIDRRFAPARATSGPGGVITPTGTSTTSRRRSTGSWRWGRRNTSR